MNSTGPWWGTPVITFAGVLLTLFATMWISFLSRRRESAFRWAEVKRQLYNNFIQECRELQRAPVWPAAPVAGNPLDAIRQLTVEFEIIAPRRVTERAAKTLSAAERLVEHIAKIRAESKAGHGNAIAERFRADHSKSAQDFTDAVQDLLHAVRADLDVKAKFSPLEPPP
ncbi:hypothetical protein ACIRG5_28230 [Lentzea sp. NPDC102401]|uniref:hypothetical protein n=1 Tax=Lentzea sp. NPDC102401 TaxID=3364128 RepID=UPI003807EE32